MAQQKIVWTVLPHGRVTEGELAGRLRCSIVVSPRLTPASAAENVLSAFPQFLDWPARLAQASFGLTVGAVTVPLTRLTQVDKDPWAQIFHADTPVTDFAFTDMSAVNLRSYSVRNVLRFIKTSYGALAATSGTQLPTLLPYPGGTPALRDMLAGLGTSPEHDRQGGFDRLLGGGTDKLLDGLVFRKDGRSVTGTVVGIDGKPLTGPRPLRALPPDRAALPAAIAGQFRTPAEYDFYQANRFYGRPENALKPERRPRFGASPQAGRVKPALAAPALDFHRILAAFADLPALMRRLGLVIDVALPEKNALLDVLAASGAANHAEGTIGLAVTWPGPAAPDPDANPTTAYSLSSARFLTRARTSDVGDGQLALQGAGDLPDKIASDFDVYQVDPDGTALKTVGFALSAQRLINRPVTERANVTYTTGDEQGVAALRSGGLGVSRHGRAQQVAADMAAMALKNQALAASPADSRKVALFAEDVQRGYRVDVLDDKDGHWRSLCMRRGDYSLARTGVPLDLPPDEGYVKGASTTSGDSPDDHYLHESMFRWAGWSLVAPRPGRTIRSKPIDGTQLQSEEVVDVTDQADQGTGVIAKFRALPGSLPRLRFGRRYRMRARLVDLASNSLDVKDVDVQHASDPVVYRRFEPVDPPAVVQRARLSEGESVERLVIRSDFDADAATFNTKAGTPFDQAKDTAAFDYTPVNERHVVPPKASQLLAETHGMLDAALGGGPAAIAKMYEISAREAGTLYDSLPGSDVRLITPPGTRGVITTTLPLQPPSPASPTGDRLVGGQYVIHAEPALRTPYLPDPAAGGVALRNVPGLHNTGTLGPGTHIVQIPTTEELVLLVDHEGGWPDRRGLRIVLAELGEAMNAVCQPSQIAAPPRWDPTARVLQIFLPKGQIAHLRYASFVAGSFLGQFGIPSFAPTAALAKAIALQATLGANFLITPYRPLTLVHATQHPVCEPAFLTLSPQRALGASFTDLSARVRMHGPSTGKFEVLARWTEWIDDPAQGDPRPVIGSAQLAEQALPENFENLFSIEGFVGSGAKVRPNRHEFGDTRFRLIRYHLLATTRFREYLPPALAEDPANITRLGPPLVPPPDPVDSDPGHPVVFTPSPSEVNRVVVLCSARPQAPRVAYIVPTFQWVRDLGSPAQHSTRYGDGLRVYLERPWFSSGDGELLGVALLANGATAGDLAKHDEMKPLVSQWGSDPIFDADLPPAAMRASSFPAAVASETASLDELAGRTVFVVGHRVQWDAGRKLWYCDIELSLGRSYFPFVRLALVRYQPHALPDAKISRVVLADFAQVAPRRTVSAERTGGKVQITVRGPAPERGSIDFRVDSPYVELSPVPPLGGGETGRNRIEVALQSRSGELAGSDLGWQDDASIAPVSGLLDPPGGPVLPVPLPAPVPVIKAAAPAAPGAGAVRAAVSAAAAVIDRPPVVGGIDVNRIDPAIWTGAIALPDLAGKEARLIVREYERYYADRTVPAHVGGQTVHQRVVEERLVYAEFFPL